MEKVVKITRTQSYFSEMKGKIRIVSLSDLHFSKKMSFQRLQAIMKLISTLEPNYIFWLGDNLDNTNVLEIAEKREEFLEVIKMSGEIAPTAITLLDHDMRYQLDNGMLEDLQKEFWQEVSDNKNVHVLDNDIYEDDSIRVVGYTMPTYYYHGKYPLPEDSIGSSDRKDEDVWVLIEDMRKKQRLFIPREGKLNELLFHSSIHLRNGIIQSKLKGFHHVHSGHMHEGLTPPIFDELMPRTLGMISPQRTLFPVQARNIFQRNYGTLCIINGGITKIAESQKAALQKLNSIFPIHVDVLDVECDSHKVKSYTREFSYTNLDY